MSAKQTRWKLAAQIAAEVMRRWKAGDRGQARAGDGQ